MNPRLFDVCMGIALACVMTISYNLVNDAPPRVLALEHDCLPADQGQVAITSITPEGRITCEKHAVLGYAETNIPELTCPVPESPECGLE